MEKGQLLQRKRGSYQILIRAFIRGENGHYEKVGGSYGGKLGWVHLSKGKGALIKREGAVLTKEKGYLYQKGGQCTFQEICGFHEINLRRTQ